MKKALILPVFLVSLFFSVSGQSADIIDSSIEDSHGGQDDFVLGRPAKSTFEYRINDPYQPVDTALVIDESGSMGGILGDAKSGAKGYVDNTNTGKGDRNSVVEFESSASTLQGLTGDKQEARSAINTISAGGGTDLPGGVSKGADALTSVSNPNPQQVMIVLADGGGGDPSTQADNARSNGIKVHGIMYGSGASTSEFESLTGASDCSTSSNENSDGDNCWYAQTGTIDFVYESIQQQVDTQTDVNLKVRNDQMTYTEDDYFYYNGVVGSNKEFVNETLDVDAGEKNKEFTWRPTDYGNQELLTGDSILEVNTEDGSIQENFNNVFSADVGYVDFEVSDFSVVRGGSNVYVEAEISNNGNADSLGESQTSRDRELWLRNSYSHYSVDMPSIPAGGSKNVSFSLPNTRDVVDQNNIKEIRLDVDPSGFWDGLSGETQVSEARGEVLEPDESNNDLQVGYPPRVGAIQFDDIGGEHAFSVEASIDMPTSDPDLGKCRLRFENQDNPDIFPDNGMVEGDLVQDGQNLALCSYSNFNSSVTGFEPTDKVKVNVTVENSNGALGWNTGNHEIINRPPKASFNSPEDGSLVTGLPELEVDVYDPEGDPFNMSFMDRDSQTVLETVENAQQDSPHAIEWDTSLGKHEWRVNFSDPYDKSKTSTWEFERVIGLGYRLEQSLKTDYSSVIISEDGTGSIFIDITNPHPDQKEIKTEIKSKNGYFEPTFLQSGTNTTTYSLNEDETKTLQAQIDADSIAESRNDKLVITSTDRNVDSVNTRELDVLVRSSEAEFRDAPGLTSIYLVFIGLVSVLLFGLST